MIWVAYLRFPFDCFSSKTLLMEDSGEQAGGWRALLRWAMTPPQSVAVYFIVLVLVLGTSFYAGTLKPKKATDMGPPPVAAPHN
jgi:hypothetical protein